MRSPRLAVSAIALVVALTMLFSRAAFASAAPEPSVTIAPGATASFSIAGFSLSSSRPAPASVQVAANPTSFANGATWRNIVYYAVDWGLISSDPTQVQDALWYVSNGVWPAGDHSAAQRLVDTAHSSATPASTANGFDLLFAISGGRASATASFSSGSGSVSVANLQSTALTVYVPYGAILVGADGLPAYVVYPTGSNGNPPAQPSATPAAAQPTATKAAGLPTAQPTAEGTQPRVTPTAANSGLPTATATITDSATVLPKPTATVNGMAGAASAGNSPTPTSQASSLPPSAPTATATAVPPTATFAPTNTPTASPTTALPASPTAAPAKAAAQSITGKPQIVLAAPTPLSTVDDSFATAIPTDGTGGIPTDIPTIVYPTFTPPASGLTPKPIPSATSFFPPTATAGLVPTLAPPGFSKPTLTPTLPTLPTQVPTGSTVSPPGTPFGPGSTTAGVGATTTGKNGGPAPNVAPSTGEQSSWPLYLLIIGVVALVVGVVVIRMGNRAAKK